MTSSSSTSSSFVATRRNARDSGVLSAPLSGGEGEEAGVDGVHAQAAHHSQCDAEEWDALAGGGQSAGLMFKTVADPTWLVLWLRDAGLLSTTDVAIIVATILRTLRYETGKRQRRQEQVIGLPQES